MEQGNTGLTILSVKVYHLLCHIRKSRENVYV